MILIFMILRVMMIRLQQSVFLTSTTKASVYIETLLCVTISFWVSLSCICLLVPAALQLLTGISFSAFVVTYMTYTTGTVSVALLTAYQRRKLSANVFLGIAYNRETTNNIQVMERFRITFTANARFKLKISKR